MLGSPVWRGAPTYAFCAGLLAGGTAMCLLLLVLGSLLRAPLPGWVRVAIVAGWYLVLLARELGVLRFRLPENRRLVPETVFRLGRFIGPFQFGLEMGTGARTYLPTGLPYALAVTVALVASPVAAAVAGLGFGLGRSLMLLANLGYDREGGWDVQWQTYHRQITAALIVAFTATLAVAVLIAVNWIR
ncbi:hypothetical protein [Dactylosporangium sp. CA-139066]|uniref:hypothetical protein n=1 Tax=Dactylosporangium sp. CA-139066 TaxID=3239930 RepID=UPI003D8A7BF7